MMTPGFKKLNNLVGWLVWAIATAVYCSTIEPTASFWDCGEYIACAYKLEVGHPPGAPFFLLVGRFFTLLGGSDPSHVGMMINIMSALSSSFSILFLFWTITRLGIRALGAKTGLSTIQQWAVLAAGAAGGLAYTFSDSFWFSAVEGEVYAMSSFFTAVAFWAILKWDEEDSVNPIGAMRWLVLISYIVGISIGVHLLNLLVIPAIGYVIYSKKYVFSWKGFLLAGISSVLILGFVQNLVIPKMVKFISDYEVFFTNKMHLGYSSGTVVFLLLLAFSLTCFIIYTAGKKERYYKLGFWSAVTLSGFAVIVAPSGGGMFLRLLMLGGILYAIHRFKAKTITLNAVFLSFATLLIGYSSFFVLVIRSQANTPMDENDPENAPNMLSYLLREQYGDWPLLYGPYYNAPQRPRSEFGDGDPLYAKDPAKGNYKVVDARKGSVVKYEKEFCTPFPRMWSTQSHHVSGYKYWGRVADHHKKKPVEGRDGETRVEEIPSMGANLIYFFRYQVNYMYLRYFYWNFVGRQNDVQGSTNNSMEGNWISGIPAIDNFKLGYDASRPIHRNAANKANNSFFALPLILGLLGAYFHYRRNRADAWVVLCFFFLTGLAIVIYLNQSPYQPRERDYAYTGSFYAFAIWIGMGALFLFDLFGKRSGALAGSWAIGLAVPALMAQQGWDDHDRSLRTLSRDMAVNFLQSCAPNAILFTYIDNDTFPLWYAQEVEGIRTDVRVVNLSLLQTDWYIRQMRRAAYESKPVPFTIPEERLEAEKLGYLIVDHREPRPMPLRAALDQATDPVNQLDIQGDMLDILPTSSLYVDVDSLQVMRNKVIPAKDAGRLEKRMSWDLGGRNYITKNDLMVLDLVANNNWERPIYFAVTSGDDAYVGLKSFLQLEGLAYRLVPIRQTEEEASTGGRVNTEVMYDNVMNKFFWGGMDKEGVNLDENCVRMGASMRTYMTVLARALIDEGQPQKAKKVLDKCLEKMPDASIPFDLSMFSIVVAYYDVKDLEKANGLARQLFDILEGDLKIYKGMEPTRQYSFGREMDQNKSGLRGLADLVRQYGQNELHKDFMERIRQVMPGEESEPLPEQAR